MPPNDAKRSTGKRFATIDHLIAAVAATQHGLIELAQLLELGLSASGVRARVAAGRLHRIHRGVYAVGHPAVSRKGQWFAAVVATGADAALSHRSAAALLGVGEDPSPIDVSAPHLGGRSQQRFRIHRVSPFHAGDVTRVDGIRCTSLPRTLIDIAPGLGQRGIELTIAEAQHQKIYNRSAVIAAIQRSRGRRGVGIVRSALAIDGVGSTLTNSELEERFLALVRRAQLPLPLVNSWIAVDGGGYKCDFVWPDARLIVETDGRDAHLRGLQFEEDRRRDARLKLAGWEVVRFTWLQVTKEASEVVEVVREFHSRRLAALADGVR